jgi:hypothetical protein
MLAAERKRNDVSLWSSAVRMAVNAKKEGFSEFLQELDDG